MIFVEHDRRFQERIATKRIEFGPAVKGESDV